MTHDALTEDELRQARRVELWVVWSQDTFGYGEDRDPMIVDSLHLKEHDARKRLAQLEPSAAGNSFLRVWIARWRVDELVGHHGVTLADLRQYIARSSR